MIVYGRNVLLEALKSSHIIHRIYLQRDINIDSKLSVILDLSKYRNIRIDYFASKDLDRISKTVDHQGIVGEMEFGTYRLKNALRNFYGKSFIYILEASFVHNIGAIARTAESAGLGGVIISPNLNITASAIKSSAGAIFNVPIIAGSVFNVIKTFKENGYFIYGIERGGSVYYEADLTGSSLFIIGGENKSISQQISSKCDSILSIPQFGKVNSLNMSVAAAVVIYEHIRQSKNKV